MKDVERYSEEAELRAENTALKKALRRTSMALALSEAFMSLDESLHHRLVVRLEPQDRFESVDDFRSHVKSVASRVLREDERPPSQIEQPIPGTQSEAEERPLARSELFERLCPSLTHDLG